MSMFWPFTAATTAASAAGATPAASGSPFSGSALEATSNPRPDAKKPKLAAHSKFASEGSCQKPKAGYEDIAFEEAKAWLGDAPRRIGRGTYGSVFQGKDPEKAIKVCPNVASEVDVLKRVSHPNIVEVYDSGRYFMVTKLYMGGDIVTALGGCISKAVPVDVVANIGRQMRASVTWLHFNQIVHRDIKLENFLVGDCSLTATSHIALTDFGCAVAGRCHFDPTDLVGTKAYWPPELVQGVSQPYDGMAVDGFAIGACWYVLLAGRRFGPKLRWPSTVPKVAKDAVLSLLNPDPVWRCFLDNSFLDPPAKPVKTAKGKGKAKKQSPGEDEKQASKKVAQTKKTITKTEKATEHIGWLDALCQALGLDSCCA